MPADQPPTGWRTERSCPICWTAFTPAGPRHRYCSERCRKAGHARRHGAGEQRDEQPRSRPAPVAVRACPHCGGDVSVVALLTTPEAARPAVPEPGVIPLRRA